MDKNNIPTLLTLKAMELGKIKEDVKETNAEINASYAEEVSKFYTKMAELIK